MARNILFDPDVVIPRQSNLRNYLFWIDLIDWINDTPGARMGASTYKYFVDHLSDWLSESGLPETNARSLITRVATAVFDVATEPRDLTDCRHVVEAYLVDDRRELLIDDIANLPQTGIDIATVASNWELSCSSGKTCRRCRMADIALALSRGLPAERYLGENIDGELTRLPFDTCVSCLQDSSGNHYAEDVATGLWWTRDNDGHGGVVFKTYTRTGRALRFDADRDANGANIPSKHKGPKRLQIPLTGLSNCSNPTRHTSK